MERKLFISARKTDGQNICVVNDVAIRGVKLCQDFNDSAQK